uniref:Asparaginyl-tRNA synthetase 1 n=1 Tax=Eptatretus burgeri TaxID=7764 RepID=A0A8C4QSI6_EPTBU
EPFPTIYVDAKGNDERWEVVSKTQLKTQKKIFQRELMKQEAKEKKEAEDVLRREKNLEEAKKITIELDASLPAPAQVKICQLSEYRHKRVKVHGWVHRLRRQGKTLMFVILRDGTGILQCVFNDDLCQCYNSLLLSTESSITVYGTVTPVPDGKMAPGGHELICDYWEVVGFAPAGGADNLLNEESNVDVLLDNRHMMIRGENQAKILKMRSLVMQCFRDHYFSRGYYEVMDVFVDGRLQNYKFCKCDIFLRLHQRAVTCSPIRYTHVEAECPFISFDDLLARLEDLVCDVVDRVLASSHAALLYEVNPSFKAPQRPFRRMDYSEAISWLKEHDVKKDDGTYYEFGEDIPEAPERLMTDTINEPILLCRFPAAIKSFYMQRCAEDRRLTESVDVLIPNVGEVVGGSMRIWDSEELLEGYKREDIDPTPYYWYTDQRKFGTCPHGGYGLGLERFLTWLLNRHHIRDVCLYPRFVQRCRP